MGPRVNIGAAAKRAGLSTHVVRAWERRYAALHPSRTGGNQRLYTAADVERLRLLERLCRAGHRIGRIANLSAGGLRALAVGTAAAAEPVPAGRGRGVPDLLARCQASVEAMDAEGLGRVLDTARVFLPSPAFLGDLVLPLMRWVGERWRSGDLRIMHEHAATAVVRSLLDRMAAETPVSESAPLLVIATPPGEWHELGALAARVSALTHGWRVLYLGANIPPAEIAGAADAHKASAVALGVTFDAGNRAMASMIRDLRKQLEGKSFLMVGGPASARCSKAAGLKSGATIASMSVFGKMLDCVRTRNVDL
ncbi:MAG: hypothetical protein BWK77_08525 [Verrucomicrobia bacterium A1]|nr:MAG: hypothetical protein BWK77_08525 [Verrucomicrobia bacterium A1]